MSTWPETQLSLIGRLADPNDASAWQYFEQCYQSAIYRYARNRGLQADEAMDVVQEVLLAVHRRAIQWKPSGHAGSFRAWLSETARRTTLAAIRFRSRNGKQFVNDDHEQSEENSPTNIDRDWLFCSAVAAIEKESNPLHWKAFWKLTIEDQSAANVARELSMKLGTVYSAKSRILARIREWIDEDDSRDKSRGAT